MNKIIKLTTLSLAMLLAAFGANAQTPYATTGNSAANAGSTDLSITVEKSADLRSHSANSGVANGASFTGVSDNNALNVNLTFNNASPSNNAAGNSGTSRFSTGSIPIRLRSNANYQVKAFLEGTGIPAGAGNSGDFKTGDIGFGLTDPLAPAGSTLLFPGGSLNVAAPFNNSPRERVVTEGQPQYLSSLNNIGEGSGNATMIASGNRISLRGDNTSDNWRSVRMLFSVKPQYYTPGTYTKTFKVFIVTP